MWHLIADVGGTNMRLAALSETGEILRSQTLHSSGDIELERACAQFAAGEGSAPGDVVLAAAGVVEQGRVTLTNARQSASEQGLAAATGAESATILNDFEAAAWSLATVTTADVTRLQGPDEVPAGTRVIIGPGTGLGVGALVVKGDHEMVAPGEGGHIAIGPRRAELVAVFQALVAIWPEVAMSDLTVEAEALLSGTGIPYFYRALARAKGAAELELDAAEVFQRVDSDPVAAELVELFGEYLGAVAGDVATLFKAEGGVFVTGGVVQKNPGLLGAAFLRGFGDGGRYNELRSRIPLYRYEVQEFGLIGARNYALRA